MILTPLFILAKGPDRSCLFQPWSDGRVQVSYYENDVCLYRRVFHLMTARALWADFRHLGYQRTK